MYLEDSGANGTRALTQTHFAEVLKQLNEGTPVPLGLVLVDADESLEVWRNHQVLAYGYRFISRDTIEILIYDPNYPLRDDISLRCTRVIEVATETTIPNIYESVAGQVVSLRVGNRKEGGVRGFFSVHEGQD